MKNRKSILLIVLLLAVGFAAVSTTLYINGSTNINPNQDDFNVYYSDAYVNGAKDLSVITEDTVIEFTTTFEKINQKYVLEYEVTNGSKNYDAELEMVCTGSNDYLTVTNELDTNNILSARESRLGTLIIEQTKSYVGDDLEVTIECVIDANALERTSLNEDKIQTSGDYIIEGYYKDENNNSLANKNLVIFSDTPHYVTTGEDGYMFYNGLERGKHEIYYVDDSLENIKNMTKSEIIEASNASASFNTRTIEKIEFDNNSSIISLQILENTEYCEALTDKEWTFSYTGKEQLFITKCDGNYKVELWGAAGGGSYPIGGYGAYTSGITEFNKQLYLYVLVGGAGNQSDYNAAWRTGGYNGGGRGMNFGGSGGGATDIRINQNNLNNRIMVAAGGGGAGYIGGAGGAAGGLNGYNSSVRGIGAKQTSGYGFGVAGDAYLVSYSVSDTGGGGGGYYGGHGGGTYGTDDNTADGGGGGGSSFISGHNGCDAINESGSHTGQANHYSGYIFTDTIMVDGAGYNWTTSKGSYTGMPNHAGTSTMTGNTGNGYAKITYLGTN